MITTTRFPRKRSTIIHSFPRKKKKETSQIERFILDTIKRLWKFSQFLITDRYEDRVYEIRPPNLEIHWSHDAKSGQRSTNPAFTCRRSDKYSTRSMRSHRSRFLSKTVWNRHQREPRPVSQPRNIYHKRNHDLHAKREETPRQRSPVSQLGRFCLENRLASLL